MPIAIRLAVPDDAEAIARLNAAFDDLRATPEHIAAHLRDRSAFERGFVAEADGTVVGMACLRLLPCLCDPIPYAELTELFVDSAYRRAGIGRDLVQRIEAEAHAAGAATLVLMTAWRNSDAHAFYHALGYRLYTIMMQRSLDAEGDA
jgi:GNAT superfamily N-acetyltransferase